jgi:hypothetical protein
MEAWFMIDPVALELITAAVSVLGNEYMKGLRSRERELDGH